MPRRGTFYESSRKEAIRGIFRTVFFVFLGGVALLMRSDVPVSESANRRVILGLAIIAMSMAVVVAVLSLREFLRLRQIERIQRS